MSFDMSNYVSVDERIAAFREKYPDGSLQPADPAVPYRIETIGDRTFIVVVAAAYRSAEDQRPGVGMAYEPFPGATSFTKDSELQNAETSAWGRAIVAALAADTKRGIASRDEVQNRKNDTAKPAAPDPEADALREQLVAAVTSGAVTPDAAQQEAVKLGIGTEKKLAAAKSDVLRKLLSSLNLISPELVAS